MRRLRDKKIPLCFIEAEGDREDMIRGVVEGKSGDKCHELDGLGKHVYSGDTEPGQGYCDQKNAFHGFLRFFSGCFFSFLIYETRIPGRKFHISSGYTFEGYIDQFGRRKLPDRQKMSCHVTECHSVNAMMS